MSDGDIVDLLDTSLLIALASQDHVHHRAAAQWRARRKRPVATCPLTQGGLVRFMVRAGASGSDAQQFLAAFLGGQEDHRFWPDDVGYDRVDLGAVVGHRQVTDAYLAGLARARGGRVGTLDRGLAALHPDVADLVPT